MGIFRAGVDPVQLYVTIAGVSYFYLSNIHTLSVIFDAPLDGEARWRRGGRTASTSSSATSRPVNLPAMK